MYEIRAHYDQNSIVVYQAFRKAIAEPAIQNNTFQAPFSMHRMTWIKPSFLWLMARSQWAQKSGQEHILGVRIHREAWEYALSQGVLTSPEKHVYRNAAVWEKEFKQATVHIQWDPEYTLRGAKCTHRSIQVGISRHLIQDYVDDWIIEIEDWTARVHKIRALCKAGKTTQAKRQLPPERVYPVPSEIARRLGI